MKKIKLAVYGTLKRGKRNHSFLSKSKFLGDYHVGKEYTLYSAALPYLKADGVGGLGAHVELYEVSEETLKLLDLFEGHPLLYTRTPVDVYDVSTGMKLKGVECYLYNGELSNKNSVIVRSY